VFVSQARGGRETNMAEIDNTGAGDVVDEVGAWAFYMRRSPTSRIGRAAS
jgi:hypothetical protein